MRFEHLTSNSISWLVSPSLIQTVRLSAISFHVADLCCKVFGNLQKQHKLPPQLFF